MNLKNGLNILTALALIMMIVSCSTSRPEGQTEAEVLFREAQELYERKRYLLATERLNTLRSQHPYSFYTAPAELLQADIFFAQKQYSEAAAAYSLFRDFHPRHEKITYVIYRLGDSYFQQIPRTYDRDLTPAKEAIRVFNELNNRYPGNPYTDEVREKVERASEMLINRELYVADFYFRTKVYDSAKFRYLEIIERDYDRDIRDLAMKRVVYSAYRLKEHEECQNYYQQFIHSISEKNRGKLEQVAKRCL